MNGNLSRGSAKLWASLASTSTDIHTPPASVDLTTLQPGCWWMKFRMLTELGRQTTLICASQQGKMEGKKEKKGSSVTPAGDKGTFHLGWKSHENCETSRYLEGKHP